MNHWESQIRTNLEDAVYSDVLDRGIASTPGALAAGLVNVRYGEGCLRGPAAAPASEAELAQLIALSQWLFPPEPPPESNAARAAALTHVGPIESAFWTTRRERLFAQVAGERVLVLAVPSARNLGSTFPLVREAAAAASETDAPDLEQMRDVLASAMLDTNQQAFSHVHRGYGEHTQFAFDDAMAAVLSQFFNPAAPRLPALFHESSGQRLPIVHLQLATATRLRSWSALAFDPEHLMFVLADRQVAHQGLVLSLLNRASDDTVRVWADGLLQFGVDAIVDAAPKTSSEARAIVEELRALHENDLLGRLRIGGLANYGMRDGEAIQRCKECVYFHSSRRWCDLPELPIPVDPHWRCRLWKP